MEYYFINTIAYFARHEIRDMMPYLSENESNYDIDSPNPTYISEYIGIVGNLFLAGYIDFLCDWDDEYKQTDYPTNLSYYGNSKYEAWVYFRDNFFYKKKFSRSYFRHRATKSAGNLPFFCCHHTAAFLGVGNDRCFVQRLDSVKMHDFCLNADVHQLFCRYEELIRHRAST